MLVLRIVVANAALVVAWVGTLLLMGFRPMPTQLALLVMGVATSSLLITRALVARERSRRTASPALLDDGTQPEG